MARKPHVALIVETSSIYGRRILEGINAYIRSHRRWTVFLEQRALTSKPPVWIRDWQGDGLISRSTTPELLKVVENSGLPIVELTDRRATTELPHVWSDDRAIGRLAFEHLYERGFRQLAYCGYSREFWSQQREAGFAESAARAGCPCETYHTPWYGSGVEPWEEGLQNLSRWLASLPKPAGVMACNDIRGKQVLDACSQAGLAVPETVAVIGVDDDELMCELCDPPLSSVVPNPEAVGYLAAELLDDWMAGGRVDIEEHLIPPTGISVRQSSDVLAINDADVAAALRYIRQHACDGVTVQQVVDHVAVSRSILERRFRKFVGHSPQAVIRQTQLNRVQELLRETDLSLDKISQLAGYKHVEHMCVVFRRELGETPGRFRRRVRP
jgi:LacI family transcriptional regulator